MSRKPVKTVKNAPQGPLYTTREAREYLGLGKTCFEEQVSQGALPIVRLKTPTGGRLRVRGFRQRDLDAWIARSVR